MEDWNTCAYSTHKTAAHGELKAMSVISNKHQNILYDMDDDRHTPLQFDIISQSVYYFYEQGFGQKK